MSSIELYQVFYEYKNVQSYINIIIVSCLLHDARNNYSSYSFSLSYLKQNFENKLNIYTYFGLGQVRVRRFPLG